jgi:hypothetical protein
MESQATLSVVASFTLILDGLLAAIAARIQDYPFNDVMVVYLWKRVNRVKNRFLALAALIQAGRIPRERTAKPRARKRSSAVGPDGINWRKWLPLGTFAWLCWLMRSLPNRFGAAQFGDQLRHLLGRTEMQALLAATPKAGRLLAPLCFMLGIEASLLRPVRAASPPRPAPAPEILAPEILAPEILAPEILASEIVAAKPEAAALDNGAAPFPLENARPRAPEPPPEPDRDLFVLV